MQELHTPAQAAQWLRERVRGTLRTDSRQVAAGDGFVAWPGAVHDGRAFVAAALAAGATACVVEHEGAADFDLGGPVATLRGLKAATGAMAADYFGQPARALPVLAVTGTNGKTSTAWWLAHALSALPEPLRVPAGLIGTLGVGAAGGDLVPTGLTTPDPVRLQQALRDFADQGLRACAIEASSIGLEERRLEGTDIAVAIFTNLTQDHLDYHGSMAAYWESKRRLFAWPGLRAAVVNTDDAHGLELAQALQGQRAPKLDLWTYSVQGSARLQARHLQHSAQGLSFEVCEGAESVQLRTRLLGSYNVSNVLAVLGAMRSLGVPLADAARACSALRPVPGRMECVDAPGAPVVAVDYAHTPDALDQALAALRPLAQQRGGQLWCVFGCGGDRDASKRPLMGAIAGKRADRVVVTSDNPRSEKPEAIIAQILRGLAPCATVEVQQDRARAIAHAVATAQAQDVVLLAGKGHEDSQEIAGVKTPFSDLAHARHALELRATAVCGVAP
jgi:UDP-N-acetylmuramoyl-L-alanyl-D-glutamate--2,6-diaminopimelate ligase